MAEMDMRQTLVNIARQANSLLQQYQQSGTLESIENLLTTPRNNTSNAVSINSSTTNASTLTSSQSSGTRTNLSGAQNRGALRESLRRSFPSLTGGNSKGKGPLKEKKKKTSNVVYKDLILLPKPDTKAVPTHRTRITLENEGFVIHEFPVDRSWCEEEFKMEICKAFPLLEKKESKFQFVKACYGEVVKVKVPGGVQMTAARVLSIAGQGNIYILPERVLLSDGKVESEDEDEEVNNLSDEDSDLEKCVWETNKEAASTETVDLTENQEPSTSSKLTSAEKQEAHCDHPSTTPGKKGEDQKDILKEMFPSITEKELTTALYFNSSVDEAANFLAEINSEHKYKQSPPENITLETLLEELKRQMLSEDEKKKLKVDEDDLISDALAYYKRSDFDPRVPLRVVYEGQPAADTGGVLRHFFSDLMQKLADNFFTGTDRKVPLYNADILICGMMKMIGIIVVHSILQGGPGLPIFSPAVYWYLATGSVDAAVQRLCINDCANPFYKEIIHKLHDAEDVTSLDIPTEWVEVFSDCGLTTLPNNDNKTSVIQAILFHDAIGKTKAGLDQLREGLSCLSFLKNMSQYPNLFEKLFVLNEAPIHFNSLFRSIKIPDSMDEREKKVADFLTDFLFSASQATLKKFLAFVTGAPCLPFFGLKSIELKFSDQPSIFASTCLCELTLPRLFDEKEVLEAALHGVLNSGSKAFNCV